MDLPNPGIVVMLGIMYLFGHYRGWSSGRQNSMKRAHAEWVVDELAKASNGQESVFVCKECDTNFITEHVKRCRGRHSHD